MSCGNLTFTGEDGFRVAEGHLEGGWEATGVARRQVLELPLDMRLDSCWKVACNCISGWSSGSRNVWVAVERLERMWKIPGGLMRHS